MAGSFPISETKPPRFLRLPSIKSSDLHHGLTNRYKAAASKQARIVADLHARCVATVGALTVAWTAVESNQSSSRSAQRLLHPSLAVWSVQVPPAGDCFVRSACLLESLHPSSPLDGRRCCCCRRRSSTADPTNSRVASRWPSRCSVMAVCVNPVQAAEPLPSPFDSSRSTPVGAASLLPRDATLLSSQPDLTQAATADSRNNGSGSGSWFDDNKRATLRRRANIQPI